MEGAASQRRLGEKRLLGMRKSTFRWLLVVSAFFSQFFTSGANWAYGIYSAYVRVCCRVTLLSTLLFFPAVPRPFLLN